MFKVFVTLAALLFTPHTQSLDLKITNGVLSRSVVIRAKQYRVDQKTGGVRVGISGCSGTYVSSSTVLTAAPLFFNPHN